MWAWITCLTAVLIVLLRWRRSGETLADYFGTNFFRVYARLWHGVVSNGPAPLPAKGPALLYANHTCSTDPTFLAAGTRRVLSFLIAREYFESSWAALLFNHMRCVPVHRNGRDVTALRVSLRRLSEGRVLCIFPEGGLSNFGRARPRLGRAGLAYLALRSRVPVYPARITHGPQTANVLWAWLWPSRARVTFGPAVDLSAYYDRPINRKLLMEVMALLMNTVAELPAKVRRTPKGTAL